MTQFKEHDVERPAWLGAEWDDSSWHNDAMPHATLYLAQTEHPQPVIEFWVNYAAPEDREIGTLYEVVFQRDWAAESGTDVMLWQGEDEAAAVIWERAARTAKSMIAEIMPRPDLMACSTFCELHDHCDANVLGDVEAMTKEGEAHRTAADDPEVGITGWAHQVHEGAMRIVEAWMGARR
jgi:hypothetical protein